MQNVVETRDKEENLIILNQLHNDETHLDREINETIRVITVQMARLNETCRKLLIGDTHHRIKTYRKT